ncbi:response regulator [Telluribacter sp. SYSU D00476]|uniref:response regulator n=1 Tax=Telluribacter sp. SYSU D00476 TaxID=2811430 RepID=UPI001FF3A7CA|nr:response regulator [Telluribacter sp. SYSU D00476]
MRKFKIIVVENDEDEQFFMKQGFDTSGLFEIITMVRNGDVLLEWLTDNQATLPDVILSDLNMPGKNGYDIISGIKSNPTYTHIPVIITSTSSTKTIVDKCLNLGAADYVVKPDTFIEYVPYVENLHRLIENKNLVKDSDALAS